MAIAEKPMAEFYIGDWLVDPAMGRISSRDQVMSIEPKVMDLLLILAGCHGQVCLREQLFDTLWPNAIVGEDTLARTVSKLRKALADDPKSPCFIETIPKRGYRLIAPVKPKQTERGGRDKKQLLQYTPLVLCLLIFLAAIIGVIYRPAFTENPEAAGSSALISRANDFYMRFTRADNEAAIALYEQAIAQHPDYSPAQAGLANALVQRVVRWPGRPDELDSGAETLREALREKLNQTPKAKEILSRAQALAERAIQHYEQAVAIDENAWHSLINLGEIALIDHNASRAVAYFERAYAAMQRVYTTQPQHVGPWLAPLGVVIGNTYEELNQPHEAEIWYRRVLAYFPFEPEATSRLSHLIARSGDRPAAIELCADLARRIGVYENCYTQVHVRPLGE